MEKGNREKNHKHRKSYLKRDEKICELILFKTLEEVLQRVGDNEATSFNSRGTQDKKKQCRLK